MSKPCGDKVSPLPDERRRIGVILDKEQMELAEKLLAFLGETAEDASDSTIIEQAVRAFTDEKVRYIARRYDIDVRSSTLTEMRQYRRDTAVGIAARDTLVIPVPERAEHRERVLSRCHWTVGSLECGKLKGVSYVSIYWRSPTWAVTHYARILSVEPAADGGAVVSFDAPVALPEPLCPKDPQNRLRRPRYTTLSLLLEAKSLEELF